MSSFIFNDSTSNQNISLPFRPSDSLTCRGHRVRPICGPCHHKGLIASAGYNRAISHFLMTLRGTCLCGPTYTALQCLRYQHGSCFVRSCCGSVLSSCCATRPTQARSMCHTAFDSGRGYLIYLFFICCCIQTKQTKKSLFYQDAGSFGFGVFTTLFQCKRGGAL